MEQYLRQCESRGLETATLYGRQRELERWGAWLKRRRPKVALESVGWDLIQRYLQGRTAFRAKATLRGVMSHLRNFGEHLTREGFWKQNPLRWMHGPKVDIRWQLPRRIGREDMRRLWTTAAEERSAFQKHLWLALLSCLYGTGLRRGELERLNLESWDREKGLLRIDGKKTGQERLQPVNESVALCLEAYLPQRQNVLEKRGRTQERALFVNRLGQRYEGEKVGTGVRKLAAKAGIGRVTLHQFRHTCASDLLENGVGLAQVQEVLGHQSISSTVRYLHVSDPERRKAIARHPIVGMLKGGCDGE